MANSPRAIPSDPLSDVTVLLGDPTLPDATKRDQRFHEEDLECVERLKQALAKLCGYRFTYWNRHESWIEDLIASPPKFVLNLCDTGFRNQARLELHVPALLELLGIPYSGATPACIPLCYDKAIVRAIALGLGVPVPEEQFVPAERIRHELPLRYPALIKPNQADGSVGLTQDALVENHDEARAYLDGLTESLPGRDVLIQEYLPGPEYGIGAIGNPADELQLLPALEVDFSGLAPDLPPLLSFESKALPDSPYWTDIRFAKAELDAAVLRRLSDHVRLLFARLGLRDYARFDFRTDASGTIKLMEVNPNPAWAHDGKLAFMASFAGIDHSGMLGMILAAAHKRIRREEGQAAKGRAQ
jgi:D-alanine-D-alanine ligase